MVRIECVHGVVVQCGGVGFDGRRAAGALRMLMWLALGPVLAAVPSVGRLSDLPLAFESSADGGFIGRSGPAILRLSASGAALGAHGFQLLGANPDAPGAGEAPLSGKSHYFLGDDPRQWRTHVATYARVRFRSVYPGIDIVYYGRGRELEFDFVVTPGGDPGRIQLACSGGFCRALREPVIYQEKAGKRRPVSGRFTRQGDRLAFRIGKWDRARPLVIDPVLSFASLVGGGDADSGAAVTVDGAGFIYVLGATSSSNFPLVGEYQSSPPLYHSHLFVSKLNPGGTALVYSTYLGGSVDEVPGGIAVDVSGAIYVGGSTTSQDFPLTTGPAPSSAGPRVFAMKFNPDGGSLLYSTLVGSAGVNGGAIAVDGAGNAYIANGLAVSKLDTAGREAYSTPLGVAASRIAVDDAGNAYAAGSTSSSTLATRNAFQSAIEGQTNGFVAKLDGQGRPVYATYFGGNGTDTLAGLAVDAAGSVLMAGRTTSTNIPAAGTVKTSLSTPVGYMSSDGGDSWSQSDFGLPSGAIFTVDAKNAAIYAVGGQRLYKSIDGGNWRLVLREWSVTAFAISPSAPLTLYVSATNGPKTVALLRSSDGGLTWDTASAPSFRVLAVDPRDPLIVYGGVGGLREGDGVFKSTDGGITWNATSLAGPMSGVSILTATSAAMFAVLGSGAVFSSRDGGENWTPLQGVSVGGLVADPVNPAILYGVSFAGIQKSTDGGNTFSVLAGSPRASALAIAPADPATLYASTGSGLYKSADSGAHWQAVTGLPVSNIVGLAVDGSTPPAVYLSTFGDADGFVAKLSPSGSELAYATYFGGRGPDSISGLALGPDGSAYITGTSSALDFPVLAPFRSSGRAAGSDGFVARLSADGTALLWSGFLGGASPAAIAVAPGGGVCVTGSSSAASFPTTGSLQPWTAATAIYRSSDGGAHWIGETPNGVRNVTFLAVHPTIPSRILAVAANLLFLTTDAGASWNQVVVGNVSGLVFDPMDPATAYAIGDSFWLSTDGGLTWTTVSSSLSGIRSLAIDPKDPATFYAATRAGLSRSANRGTNWISILSGNYSMVRVDPRTSATLYVAAQSSVQKSTDGGATWSVISSGLPENTAILDFQIDPNNAALYVAAPSGMFRSSDGGTSWDAINHGLILPPGSGVAALAFDKLRAGTMYAAVVGGGVYRSSDRGDTWTRLPLEISKVQALAVDPVNGVRLYAGAAVNPSDAFVAKIEE